MKKKYAILFVLLTALTIYSCGKTDNESSADKEKNENNHIKKISLVTDFKHLDPGKFWSDLPYLKGCMLMRLIEDLIGEENLFFIIVNFFN